MCGQQTMIRCSIYRGGTSKGLYLLESDLPRDPVRRDRVILALYGSPDARQIDGLGGAHPLTSKVAVIGRSARPGVDVDYTFGQVGIASAHIDRTGNCGNISAGVGPFSIDQGLVKVVEPVTEVRIFNENTRKVIVARVPVVGGQAAVEGDYVRAGVPGSGAPIRMAFLDPTGSVTEKMLPTGQPRDILDVKGHGPVTVSVVDAGNPVVFVDARDLGMCGTELPDEIEANKALLAALEAIRSTVAEMLGLVEDVGGQRMPSRSVPKIIAVAPPQTYQTVHGQVVQVDELNLVARAMTMQRAHKAYPITGAICTTVAVALPGTVPAELALGLEAGRVRIGHPAGVLPTEVAMERRSDGYHVEHVTVFRTARRLMSGYAYVRSSIWRG